MLGAVASNNLVRSLCISTGLVAGALVLFTAIPYFTADDEPAPVAESIPAKEKHAEEKPAEVKAPETSPETPAAPDPLSSLGVGGEIAAPPGTNPLEDKGDDFLKDLE